MSFLTGIGMSECYCQLGIRKLASKKYNMEAIIENMLERDLLGANIYKGLGMNQKKFFPRTFKDAKKVVNQVHRQINWDEKKIKKEIDKKLRSSVRIDFAEYGSHKLSFGCSKFGGKADLPFEQLEPIIKGTNLSLLCQINLKDIEQFDLHPMLPKSGVLYFFFQENQEVASESLLKVHYEANVDIDKERFTSGYKTLFYPIFTMPTFLSSSLSELISQFPLAEEKLDRFVDSIAKGMDYSWIDTLLLAEPIPLQSHPFETSKSKENYCIPLLEFAYRNPKYHVGILEEDLRSKNFEKVVFSGANT